MPGPVRRAALALLVAAASLALLSLGGAWPFRAPPAPGSLDSCGAAGRRCGSDHATATCAGGVCQLACAEGFADCDRHPGNGCEAELGSDDNHCGSCARSCGGARCVAGRCQARLLGPGAALAAA